MKACPKCQTNNQESSNFCKKCGVKLSGPTFEDKKEKVLGEKKEKLSWRIISIAAAAVFVMAGFAYWLIQRDSAGPDLSVSSQPKVSAKVDYSGQKVSMTDIVFSMENGRITVPVETVLEKKIVRFEYDGNGTKVPLLSYVTQGGKLITAVSMCEPCRSTRFHIEAKKLVCNACGTEWNLETLKGIQGGCLNYPPEVIPSTIDKGLIQIDEKIVTQWKPRV
ncbi:MAG: DUF2318 domain-containing protein [Deltaproteobacteria bacterium]|nr:MAG: DUF2318 domain-containing protein [Deltaproteobacteria bacterium]